MSFPIFTLLYLMNTILEKANDKILEGNTLALKKKYQQRISNLEDIQKGDGSKQ